MGLAFAGCLDRAGNRRACARANALALSGQRPLSPVQQPQKDPLWNQYLHPALLRDFTVRLEGPEGERVYAIQENVQRRVSLALRGMPVSRIRILPQKNWGASYIAIHEVALLIDVKARDYTG